MAKNPPANAGHRRDIGSIPDLGGSLEEGMAIHSSILAWRIPRMEKPGGSSGLAPPQRKTLPSPQGVVLPSYVLGLVPYRAQDITDSGALISCQEEEEEAGREARGGEELLQPSVVPGIHRNGV